MFSESSCVFKSSAAVVMIRVHKISGGVVAALSDENVNELIEKSGDLVKGIKSYCKPLLQAPIFRQRLLLEGEALIDGRRLKDLERPLDLQVVLVPFAETDYDLKCKMIAAVCEGPPSVVESCLQIPIDPNELADWVTMLPAAGGALKSFLCVCHHVWGKLRSPKC